MSVVARRCPGAHHDAAKRAAAAKTLGGLYPHAARAAGTRSLLVSHDPGQARRLAGDVVFLNRGEVLEHRPAADFFTRPTTDAARAFLQGDIVE